MSGVEANPPTSQESKTAKKKKAKAGAAAKETAVQPAVEADVSKSSVDLSTNGADASYESPYMKELYKRSWYAPAAAETMHALLTVTAQNATQKVDSIIAENPNQTLEELLAARKINQDQKTQAQKKPALQASLAQLEEQVAQYKQFDEDYQKRLASEKAALETSHKEELDKVKDAAISAAKAESAKEAKDNLLVLSKFLRAAAAKRQGGDEASPENRAFEGALLLVYGGEAGAVAAMESLIVGSDDKVPTVDQVPSEYTCKPDVRHLYHYRAVLTVFIDKQVRDLAFEYAPYAAEEAWAEDVAQSEPAPPPAEEPNPTGTEVGTDPTVAHAGLTELDTTDEPTTNGVIHHVDTPTVPEASNIDAGAANAAASDPNWEAKLSASAESGPEGWVEVALLRAGLKTSPLTLNGIPPQPRQRPEPQLVRMASTKCVGAVVPELRETIVEVGAGVVVIVGSAEVKAGIVAVAVDIAVTAVEEKGVIVAVAEAGVETVAVVMAHHSEQSDARLLDACDVNAVGALALGSDT
ncbi:MAG: hypothetical protein LQ344_001186 [Seirophora lacunosa]|nr:MAG: hypothetical protein LQ344_001186 [Seirophora lacunosa]